METTPHHQFRSLITEFSVLTAIMLLIPFIMYLDIKILDNEMKELSATELLQSGLVLISAILFLKMSHKFIESKGLFILIAGLFGAIFIREADYYLDFLAVHLWKVLTLILLFIVAYHSYRNKNTIFRPLTEYVSMKSFSYFLIGFLIVMAFSRIFGLRDIWQWIMEEDYRHVFKTAIQESLELLGYTLMFYSALLTYRYLSKQERLVSEEVK